jgi:galactonate dehydratase
MVHATQRRRAIAGFAAMQSRQMAGAGEHSIAKVLAYAVPPASTKGEGYSVLRIETKSGVTGYGECGPISVADVKALSSIIAGKSAFAYEPLSEIAPRSTRGGVNMALLDIAGKITKAPVYRVLGGPTRTKARAVARLQGSTDAEIISEAEKHATAGVRAFLVPIEPPSARNQGSLFIKTNLDRLNALRAAIPKADFAIAGASQLTPSDAASLASAAEKDRPLWFDQPCDITNLDALRKVCDETVVPVAFGRDIGNPGVFQDLLRRV